MRNKAPLAMMEQLVMLLVFALAAALCLQAFVMADGMSERNAQKDAAIISVQNAAETVKACCGDLKEAKTLLGGEVSDDTLSLSCKEGDLTVRILPKENPLLGSAQVLMTAQDGSELFSVTVLWQEGGGA